MKKISHHNITLSWCLWSCDVVRNGGIVETTCCQIFFFMYGHSPQKRACEKICQDGEALWRAPGSICGRWCSCPKLATSCKLEFVSMELVGRWFFSSDKNEKGALRNSRNGLWFRFSTCYLFYSQYLQASINMVLYGLCIAFLIKSSLELDFKKFHFWFSTAPLPLIYYTCTHSVLCGDVMVDGAFCRRMTDTLLYPGIHFFPSPINKCRW